MVFLTENTNDILDSISEAIFTVDKDFRINFINSAAEKILGVQRSEVLGKFCQQVFKSSACYSHCPIATVLETGKKIDRQFTSMRHHNGQKINISLNAAVIENGNKVPTGGVISFHDVTEYENLKRGFIQESTFHGVVGHSKAMKEIFSLIEEISDSDSAVLILGPSGTGKEMVANAIQASSLRKDKPYIKVNCSVFSPQLLASELFGHVKGAFTSANRDRPGRFEIADQGTIFLDEVAEMPLQMQIQLLRVLQEGTFERVGESVTRKVDIRVIAATNVNLEKTLREGHFREDLFYRLNVVPIHIPPLRERLDDIPSLVRHFIKKYASRSGKNINDIDDDALNLLISNPWPGNVRELENAIEYAFARTRESKTLEACKLPANIRQGIPCGNQGISYHAGDSEFARIMDLLEEYRWNKSKVAQVLGIGRTTLWRKLQKYDISLD